MEYTLNQWPYLVGYCERGDLQLSNVQAENAIRPFALGRKAWLFADSSQGARASASCYSLLETAKANGLEPSAYIRYVLERIAEVEATGATRRSAAVERGAGADFKKCGAVWLSQACRFNGLRLL